jgi:hypothetical protein
MQSLTILALTLVGVGMASIAVEDITYEHFASHDANLATFGVDLTPWGYSGGQLPKHYAISGNGSFNYMPTDSYTIFKSIISGEQNYTGSIDNEAVLSTQLATRDADIAKRCETMNFNLYGFVNGNACTTGFSSSCIDPGACYYGNGCGGWNSITMCRFTPILFFSTTRLECPNKSRRLQRKLLHHSLVCTSRVPSTYVFPPSVIAPPSVNFGRGSVDAQQI